MTVDEWRSARERTAIGRGDLSMPVRQCLRDEIISTKLSLLDYGCGRGQDVARLSKMGVKAMGGIRISPQTRPWLSVM